MTLNLEEVQPLTLADWAKARNLVLSAQNIGARPDNSVEWSKDAIHFSVTLQTTDKVVNPVLWIGCYTVGSAHPEMWARKSVRECHAEGVTAPGFVARKAGRELKEFHGHQRSLYAEGFREQIVTAYKEAAPIPLVDVLDSLRMDAMGADQSFEDWAGEYGMETDSRKALAMYEQCRDVLNSLRRYSAEDFDSLMECEGL